MEELIKQYEAANQVASNLLHNIRGFKDGHLYLVQIDAYGSHSVSRHNNYYTALLAARDYNGDNGYATIYTDNLKYDFDKYEYFMVVQRPIGGLFEHAEKYKNHNLTYRLKLIQSSSKTIK